MSDCCPSVEKCPIYTGVLQGKEYTTKAYKMMYCEAGDEGKQKCKRWQIKQKYGSCPPTILPNTADSIESIGTKYRL